MKKLVLTAAAVVAMSTAAFAMADNSQYPYQPQSQQAKHGGFYVGGSAGYGDVNLPEADKQDKAAGIKTDKSHITANAHAGYLFPVTDKFLLGVEGGYNYLPSWKVSGLDENGNPASIKLTSYSIDFLGVAKYYVTDQFDLFAKAGGTYLHETAKGSYVDKDGELQKGQGSDGKVKPKIGVGAGYMIMPQLELTAEYSHTFGTNYTDKDRKSTDSDYPSNNAFLVGLNYYFN